MPFGTITSQTVSFGPRNPGIYADTAVTFGSPTNEFRIRPATAPSKDGNMRASITRVLEKDTGSPAVRKACVVTLSINIPKSGFTSTEVDSLATDLSNFVTADTVSRILQGEA